MTPWQNERWAATAPENDGKNFAPAHRWAIMGAMPLCYGLRDWNYHVEGMPCESCDDRVHLSCPHVNGILRNWASPEASTAALLRVYIREAHELREENANLRDAVLELEADLAFEAEGNAYADAYIAELRDCIATLEAALQRQVENVERWIATGTPADEEESRSIYEQMVCALRGKLPRCPDCGHRLDTEECGCARGDV